MPIQTYVTSVDSKDVSSFQADGKQTRPTLGAAEDFVAVQLQELLVSVTESIKEKIESESSLTIEITGSVSLKTQGGASYLFFNVGAETGTEGSMKVILSTTIKPKNQSS